MVQRAKISDIFDDEWFQEGYNPSEMRIQSEENYDCVDLEEVGRDSDSSHSTEVTRMGYFVHSEPDLSCL